MQFKTYLKSKLPFYLALSSLFVLASCGSYQYVGQDSDGIYTSSQAETPVEETETASNNNSYYKGYFAEKSDKYERIASDDNVIFTDIDDYEGTYNEVTDEVEYEESYAGWGQNPSNVTINVYDNSWYQPWGWGYGFGWYQPWGWNYGWGYYGWNNWGWNYGWGWNSWGWGNAWCPSYYYPYYGRNVAYNNGRRGSYASNYSRNSNIYRNNDVRRSNNNSSTRRNTSVRNSSTTRYNPANSVRSNTRTYNPNIRTNSTRSDTRVNSSSNNTTRSNSRINSPSRPSSSSSGMRSSSPSRSSSSGSSGRSSGGSSRRGG